MSNGTAADYDSMESLASLLARRGSDLTSIATGLMACGELADPDVATGVRFIRQTWRMAVGLLGSDLETTSHKVSTAVLVYEKSDRVIGTAISESTPTGTTGPGERRAM